MAEPGTLPIVVSIQVGRPQLRTDENGKVWSSAIFKHAVQTPLKLGKTNLEGDRQADLSVHGGPDKAVLAYAAEHYTEWHREGLAQMDYGAFGENFTISGQTEADVCLGDVYRIGEARVEVSQPRSPCAKLARKWKLPDLPARVLANGRSGWYLRVLQEGMVAPRQALQLIERPLPQWTIQKVATVFYNLEEHFDAAVELSQCLVLAESWREWLVRKTRPRNS
jgi:MOSC domain-containing protein YiiM